MPLNSFYLFVLWDLIWLSIVNMKKKQMRWFSTPLKKINFHTVQYLSKNNIFASLIYQLNKNKYFILDISWNHFPLPKY